MYVLKHLGKHSVVATNKIWEAMSSRSISTKRGTQTSATSEFLRPLDERTQRMSSQPHPVAVKQQAGSEGLDGMIKSLQEVSLAPKSSSLTPDSTPTKQVPNNRQSRVVPVLTPSNIPKEFKKVALERSPKTGSTSGRSKRVMPSEASGGVPDPSPQYLEGCKAIPRSLANPQELLVVIDLNGTLLYRPDRKKPTHFQSRPNAELFLKYCIETFKVVIWSSARLENVTHLCNAILTPELRSKVIAIWGRDKFNLTPREYLLRVQCYKRLNSIWNDPTIAVSHPQFRFGGKWDQTNTVLIDDSPEKARSEPFNLVEVPDWTGNLNDWALPQVHDHLNRLSLCSNVSGHHYAKPFKTIAT